MYPLKLNFVIPAAMIKLATDAVAGKLGTSVETIFFNKVEITKINVFETSAENRINTIRASVASFYIAFRNLAIAISLATLIYIGIRMAITSIAEDKAKYKQFLINWVVGFGLIFVLHFIIQVTLTANDMLIETIGNARPAGTSYMDTLLRQIWYIPLTISFGSLFMYCILLIVTLIFLVIYIKRMITVSFLIVIAPLVCVTYSVDKVGNNKAEILNMWLREFFYNVLIQPFHCIIYLILIDSAMRLLQRAPSFGSMIYAVILTLSIFSAQKLIREIFGFKQSTTLSEKIAIFAIAKKTLSTAKEVVAMKGSANDKRAKKKMSNVEKKVGGLVNAGGGKLDATSLVGLRMKAERHNREETRSKPTKINSARSKIEEKIPKRRSSSTTPKTRRRLKNAPTMVKRAARLYTGALGKTTLYTPIKNGINRRRRNNRAAYNMNDRDIAIAMAERYREGANPGLTNEELAKEYLRIQQAGESGEELTAKEQAFFIEMKAVKAQLHMSDSDIEDALIYGSGQNNRWRSR